MRYCIRNCPNTGEVLQAASAMRVPGVTHRKRGRGHRFGRIAYHQELPLRLAERFSLYGQPTQWAPWTPIQYFDFVRVQRDGRMRIRSATS